MKKRKKKSLKNKFKKKQKGRSRIIKKTKKSRKNIYNYKAKKKSKKKINKKQKLKKVLGLKKTNNEDLISKIVKFQLSLKPNLNIKLNLNIEKYIQSFFDKISETITRYKTLKEDQKRRLKLEKIEKERLEKIQKNKQKEEEEKLKIKLKERELKDEIKLEKQRNKDIKLFLRKEQAILRIEQTEKQKQFLQHLKLERQIEKFRIREVKELEKLEKLSLREKREDYSSLQQRIEKLKEKYRIIRDQKIRERVEALGVKIQGDEDRETLLQKRKNTQLDDKKLNLL